MPNRRLTKNLNRLSIKVLESNKSDYPLSIKFFNIKSDFIFRKIADYIIGKKVLDIGTGFGGLAAYINYKGFDVTSIDVVNSSMFEEYPTRLYAGVSIPYKDKEYDTALLIHVLHHCKDRLAVLREALRVSKRVIFVEDTYRNPIEKLIGSLSDMIGNGEYYFHKYSTPEEWKKILRSEGCKIVHEESYSRFTYHILYGRHVIFVVEKI